jgi:prolyl-tRNA editing enzyme YbaK/EbsC (Cys-tRNA(Pro) deacylase)
VSDQVLLALDSLKIPYEVLPCDPAAADTAEFCTRYGFAKSTVGNTILVAGKSEPRRYAACVVPAERQLDVNHRVRTLLAGLRASFATAEETQAVTGMELGAVSPFGLPPGLSIFVDEGLLPIPGLILGAGDRSSKIRLEGRWLAAIPGVEVVPGLSRLRG